MKVQELYLKCVQLMQENHGSYDVTIEMEGDKEQRELIDDLYIKSYSDSVGLMILKTERPINW